MLLKQHTKVHLGYKRFELLFYKLKVDYGQLKWRADS